MNYNLVDERNTSYLDGKKELYNLDEIIQGIRETNDSAGVLFLLVYLIPVAAMVFITIELLQITIFNSQGIGLIIGIIVNLFMILVIYSMILAGFRHFQWRKGIRDKQIIRNLRKQGDLATGTIIKVSEGVLHYQYMVGDFTLERQFSTNQWEKFSEGDEVAVIYVFKIASCLL